MASIMCWGKIYNTLYLNMIILIQAFSGQMAYLTDIPQFYEIDLISSGAVYFLL